MKSISHMINEINNSNPQYKHLLFLNQTQASVIVGISANTLASWRKKGIGPKFIEMETFKRGGIGYSKIAIAEWLSKTKQKD